MAKKVRKLEETVEENVITNEEIVNNTEDNANAITESIEDDTKEIQEVKQEQTVEIVETVTDKDSKKNQQTNEAKKKLTQRFFGNYVWNGMVSDIILPKKS